MGVFDSSCCSSRIRLAVALFAIKNQESSNSYISSSDHITLPSKSIYSNIEFLDHSHRVTKSIISVRSISSASSKLMTRTRPMSSRYKHYSNCYHVRSQDSRIIESWRKWRVLQSYTWSRFQISLAFEYDGHFLHRDLFSLCECLRQESDSTTVHHVTEILTDSTALNHLRLSSKFHKHFDLPLPGLKN